MKVWLIKVGETVPAPGQRRFRTALMASALAKAGHSVVWWTSAFDHTAKRHVAQPGARQALEPGVEVRFLPAAPYGRNLSLRRYLSLAGTARAFLAAIGSESPPDVMVVSMPDYHLGSRAVEWANAKGIPVIVDVRDPWPDVFWRAMPKVVQPLARAALARDVGMVRRMLRSARAITSVNPSFHRWALERAGRPAGPEDRVFYLGVEPRQGPPAASISAPVAQTLAGLAGRRAVLFAGSLGFYNDGDAIVAAGRALASSTDPGARGIHILVAGTGPVEPRLRRAAEGLDNIHFMGWLDRDDLHAVSARSELGVVAMPAGHDSVPNKFFSYLELGLPVVVSDSCELARLVEAEGLGATFAAGDGERLARRLASLLGNSVELERLRAKVRGFFAQRCDANTIYPEYASLVERVAAPP